MTARRAPRIDVLFVSESPARIVEAQESVKPLGIRLVGCTGPAQAPCYLQREDRCPLTEHSAVVLVDTPENGHFSRHWMDIPAPVYAEKLAAAHPDAFVVLCGAEGASGSTRTVTASDDDALEVLYVLAGLFVRGGVRGSAA
jgi:hypothetical protein